VLVDDRVLKLDAHRPGTGGTPGDACGEPADVPLGEVVADIPGDHR
jgi:hypothetical protein